MKLCGYLKFEVADVLQHAVVVFVVVVDIVVVYRHQTKLNQQSKIRSVHSRIASSLPTCLFSYLKIEVAEKAISTRAQWSLPIGKECNNYDF